MQFLGWLGHLVLPTLPTGPEALLCQVANIGCSATGVNITVIIEGLVCERMHGAGYSCRGRAGSILVQANILRFGLLVPTLPSSTSK